MHVHVQVEEAEHMNLLGLLLAGFLRKQLTHPRLLRKARKLRGAYGVRAGKMAITITFFSEEVRISKGISKKTRARISGSLQQMLALVSGGGRVAAAIAVLEGRIGIRGNPFALIGLLPIMVKKVKSTVPSVASLPEPEAMTLPSSNQPPSPIPLAGVDP